MKSQIESAIVKMSEKVERSTTSADEAMKYAQAVLNLANARSTIMTADKMEKQNTGEKMADRERIADNILPILARLNCSTKDPELSGLKKDLALKIADAALAAMGAWELKRAVKEFIDSVAPSNWNHRAVLQAKGNIDTHESLSKLQAAICQHDLRPVQYADVDHILYYCPHCQRNFTEQEKERYSHLLGSE